MAVLDFWGILNLINQEFPQYVPILEKPGVFDVFVRYAVAKSGGGDPWSSDQLLAELHKTPWYQSSTDTERQWDMLQATDPATAKQKAALTMRTIKDLQAELGVTLDDSQGFSGQLFQFYQQAVRSGWDANEIRYQLLATKDAKHQGGQYASLAAQVRGWADAMGVPLSDQAIQDWANKLGEGAIDQAGIQGYLQEQAKSLYPGLASAIDRGITVKQYADPYIQLAAQELNINPAGVSLTDPKWMSALNQVDPKTGARVSLSLDDWLREIRTNPVYGYDGTIQASTRASQLAMQLEQKFGAAG